MLSRILHGARISLTIGLIGVAVSLLLGVIFGGLAGYLGGIWDTIIQRIIEVLQSLPSIPLWLAIAAIIPVYWSTSDSLFLHYGHSRPDRMDRSCPRRSLEIVVVARGRLRARPPS